MKVAFYSAKEYEKLYFELANKNKHEIRFISEPLNLMTVDQTDFARCICCFVTDKVGKELVESLSIKGVKLIALRSAGFDHVDLNAAKEAGLIVTRVPRYSPEAVAEFAVALILTLSRKIHHSYKQGLDYDFSLDHLIGFNLYQKTVGIIGTGNIGTAFAKIMHGFGCHLIAYDLYPNQSLSHKLGIRYVSLEELLRESNIISLHCSLNETTHHLIEEKALKQIKKGAMIINTGRGTLIDTVALLHSLRIGQVGYAGLDVYENEIDLFFKNHHGIKPSDSLFLELQQMPTVLITPHHAFFTEEAMMNIAKTTIDNITAFEIGNPQNMVTPS